jgi:TonB family protein
MHQRPLSSPLIAVAVLLLLHLSPVCADSGTEVTATAAPSFKAGKGDFYPPPAKRMGLTGRVCLEYSVDAKGHAQHVLVVESAGKVLDDNAMALLYAGHFELTSEWLESGGPAKRYRVGVIMNSLTSPTSRNSRTARLPL